MIKRIEAPLVLVVGLLFATTASGQDRWFEQGEAGDLPETAQIPDGRGPLTRISGQYQRAEDADMYQIYITDPQAFEASTVGLSSLDTQLFLFDENGLGVTHNDDDPSGFGGLQSVITGRYVPSEGVYFLAISQYDSDPTANSAEIWLDQPYGQERRPDGPGAGGVVNGWNANYGSSGSYGIDLSGVEYPNPGPSLSIGGSCPGVIEAEVGRLTPNGRVALIATVGGGQFTIPPGLPCAGVVLELNPSGSPQIATGRANAEGVAVLSGRMPSSVCGRMAAQAIDIESCLTSNTATF